jgi:lambda repressor-like predicted transcriptional regulator
MANTEQAAERAARQAADSVLFAIDAAGESINGLAATTGIPYSTLRRNLKAKPERLTLGDLLLIAEALGVSPATFTPDAFAAEVA